jgi:hypothetical protein
MPGPLELLGVAGGGGAELVSRVGADTLPCPAEVAPFSHVPFWLWLCPGYTPGAGAG